MTRVYVVGAHGVGKSTLVRWIGARYGLPVVHEVAREVLSHYPVNFDQLRLDVAAVSRYQREVFAEQAAREAAAGASYVSDRAFDNLAYLAEHGEGLADLAESQECRDYVALVRQARAVFFVRPHGDVVAPDPGRALLDAGAASQVRIDGMILLLLHLWRVRYTPVDARSPRERQLVVESVLGAPPGTAADDGAGEGRADGGGADGAGDVAGGIPLHHGILLLVRAGIGTSRLIAEGLRATDDAVGAALRQLADGGWVRQDDFGAWRPRR